MVRNRIPGYTVPCSQSHSWLNGNPLYEIHNLCSLGAAVIAGTTFPIDRRRVPRLLGFEGLVEHAQDAVAPRDFALQILAGWALFGLNCSRLAQDFRTAAPCSSVSAQR